MLNAYDVYIRQWSHSQKSCGSSKDPFMTYIYVTGTQRVKRKQSCSHKVKNDCKNLQRFSFKPLKPFFLSSEQGFTVNQTIVFWLFDAKHMSNTLLTIFFDRAKKAGRCIPKYMVRNKTEKTI